MGEITVHGKIISFDTREIRNEKDDHYIFCDRLYRHDHSEKCLRKTNNFLKS